MNPSVENYTLGKGSLFFDLKNPTTGQYEGERHLGNAPALTSNVALEELPHFSSMSGLKNKDLNIITQVSPKLACTLDEMSGDNYALNYLGDKEVVDQAADSTLTVALTGVAPGKWYELGGNRGVGIFVVGYDNMTAAFNVGATLTGGTSGATAVITQVITSGATTGTLYLQNVSGSFQDGEALSDNGGTPGAADANGPSVFLNTAVSAEDTDNAGTFFLAGVDFRIHSQTGRLYVVPGGAIDTGNVNNLTVRFARNAQKYTKIKCYTNTMIEGRMRFVSDNAHGYNLQFVAHRASVKPTGDLAYIGEDWATMGLEIELLADFENHPDSPYIDMEIYD